MDLTFRNILLNEDNWQANFSDEDLPCWMTHDEDDHEDEDIIYVVGSTEENDIIDYFFHKENAEKCLAKLKEEDPDLPSSYEVREEWHPKADIHWMDQRGWIKDSLRID